MFLLLLVAACGQLGFDALPDSGVRSDAPELDAPEMDAPELDAPELDAPELDAPNVDAGDDAAIDTGVGCLVDADCGPCARCTATGCESGEVFTDVMLTHQATCAIGGDGSRWCAGRNAGGQLGLGDMVEHTLLTRVDGEEGWVAAYAPYSGNRGGGIRNGNELWRWSAGGSPELSDDTRNWVQVHADNAAICAVDDTGGLRCSALQPTSDMPWASITVGWDHICGILTTGALFCWGPDTAGQLGLGPETMMEFTEPQAVGADTDWASVGAGDEHSCALKTDGSIWCWGLESRVGREAPIMVGVPNRVNDETDWEELAVGWQFTCARKTDGSVWCWGNNGHGQLGDGSTSGSRLPIQVAGINATQIRAGGHHTCALTGDGWKCWGRNTEGELNQGDLENRLMPVELCP